ESLLLAHRHTGMTIRLKVIHRQGARMMHMGSKCQQECWTLLHPPNTRMATTMNATLVAFRTFEPTLQIHIVGWTIGLLSPHKQPRRKHAHHLGNLLVHGVPAGPPPLPQRDELGLTLRPCGCVTRLQEGLDGAQGLDLVPYVRQGLTGAIQAAV